MDPPPENDIKMSSIKDEKERYPIGCCTNFLKRHFDCFNQRNQLCLGLEMREENKVQVNLRSGLRGDAKEIKREREKIKRRTDTNRVKPHVPHPNFGCKSDWLFNNGS